MKFDEFEELISGFVDENLKCSCKEADYNGSELVPDEHKGSYKKALHKLARDMGIDISYIDTPSINTESGNKLICIYEEWLMENYPDEVGNKDKLVELSEAKHRWEEFIEAVKEV